jgi:hypothetical protein
MLVGTGDTDFDPRLVLQTDPVKEDCCADAESNNIARAKVEKRKEVSDFILGY